MLKSLFETFESIVIIDTETTGIDYKSDEIIELAAIRVTESGKRCHIESELDVLIQLSAGRTLPPQITKLTGISEQMLAADGVPKADAAKRFCGIFDNSRTLLVAYNAQFDLCFLYRFLVQYGTYEILKQVKLLDALTVYKDRRAYPHKLSDAVSAYALNTQNTHRAIDDVKATFELLIAMEQERGDLDRYINLFGYNPKYGVSGQRISSVTYAPKSYHSKQRLYEAQLGD